jgi:hypothetical protein
MNTLSTQLAAGAGDAEAGRRLLEAIRANDQAGYEPREQSLIARAEAHVKSSPADTAYRNYVAAMFPGKIGGGPVNPPANLPAPPPATPLPTTTTQPPPATTPSGTTNARTCTPNKAKQGSKPAAVCYDPLKDATPGPSLVVVGGDGAKMFAIGRTEVTVADWNKFCGATGCAPSSGNATFPITNITASAAKDYAQWLTAQTGATYRLPTLDEWRYATSAPEPQQQSFNCVNTQSGAGGALAEANRGSVNGWGLIGYRGNAQEWVEAGSGLQAVGGHYKSPLRTCQENRAEPHSGAADELTGFRLVREMPGG